MDIATRMKSYESDEKLPKGAVIIRVDGKNFHTWTKRVEAEKPFDELISAAMRWSTHTVAEQMQGFKLAYTQSDESTFLIANFGEKEGAWFDYKAQKIASVTASLFTEAFNNEFRMYASVFHRHYAPAHFDARAFSVPVHDVANNFVWRQQDWARNSVQMLGHHYYSHKQMQGLKAEEIKTKLVVEHHIDWNQLEDWQRFGTFIIPNERALLTSCATLSYDEINRATGLDQYLEIK